MGDWELGVLPVRSAAAEHFDRSQWAWSYSEHWQPPGENLHTAEAAASTKPEPEKHQNQTAWLISSQKQGVNHEHWSPVTRDTLQMCLTCWWQHAAGNWPTKIGSRVSCYDADELNFPKVFLQHIKAYYHIWTVAEKSGKKILKLKIDRFSTCITLTFLSLNYVYIFYWIFVHSNSPDIETIG